VSIRPNSPVAALRIRRITPPTSICMPALTNGRRGSEARRWYNEPTAQQIEAPTTVTRPTVSTCPAIDPWTRNAAPANPSTSPPTTSGGCRWWYTTRSITAIHSGTVAITSAARPLGIVRSAQATAPLPQTSNRPATMAASRQCVRVGRSPVRSPRLTAMPYRTLPATKNRIDVASRVGNVSFTTRIARYVVLQMA